MKIYKLWQIKLIFVYSFYLEKLFIFSSFKDRCLRNMPSKCGRCQLEFFITIVFHETLGARYDLNLCTLLLRKLPPQNNPLDRIPNSPFPQVMGWKINETIMPYLFFALHALAMSHPCYNPIIYCYMNARFRAGFLQTLCLIPCCRRYIGAATGGPPTGELPLTRGLRAAGNFARSGSGWGCEGCVGFRCPNKGCSLRCA